MSIPTYRYGGIAPLALMGGIYGNIPALLACLADARSCEAGPYDCN
jgi:hypothetical protein